MTLVLEVLGDTLASLLHDDPRRVIFGEDVTTGGHIGLTRSIALNPELSARLVATPLVPTTMFAHAAGVALAGGLPIVVLPSAASLVDGLSGLRELARLRATTKYQQGVPALILAPSGGGFGLGGDAAWSGQSLACQLPGLRVHELGSPSRAAQTLRAAASFEAGEDPTLLLLPRELLVTPLGDDVAASEPSAPPADVIPGVRTLREGDALTILSWGCGLERALRAVDAAGQSVHVVELATLAPLDVPAIVAAASRTGRVLLVHGDAAAGVAHRVTSLVADHCILTLDAPVQAVGPAAGELGGTELEAGPSVASIYAAIMHHAHY